DTTSASTNAWRAIPSADTPRSTTTLTCGTALIRVSSRSTAASSAPVRPPVRATTSVALANDAFWNGAASADASMLGAVAGRKPLVVSLATSLNEGSVRTARIGTTTQAT